MLQDSVEAFWNDYLATLPAGVSKGDRVLVDQFGDTPELADELGQLVLARIKTATCAALWEWEAAGEPLPTIGLKGIILNGRQQPLCIIETTEITIQPFSHVDAQWAFDEGEGDRTLESWRREHWKYFSRVLPKIGKVPSTDMLLVCERFRVVFDHQMRTD